MVSGLVIVALLLLIIIIGLLLLDRNLLADLLGLPELDRVLNEHRVLLDDILDLGDLEELLGVLLQLEGHNGTSTESHATRVLYNEEVPIRVGAPDVLLGVVVALGDNSHLR